MYDHAVLQAVDGALLRETRRRAAAAHRRVALLETILDGLTYVYHVADAVARPNAELFVVDDEVVRALAESPGARPVQHIEEAESGVVHPHHGRLTLGQANVVSAEIVKASGQFAPKADFVRWPSHFYMEVGMDRRDLPILGDRHPIDWFRGKSYMAVLPNLASHEHFGDPYYATESGFARNIGMACWETLRTREFVDLLDDTDRIARDAGKRPNNGQVRFAIRDCLRDLALFGLCTRYVSKRSGVPVYGFGKPPYHRD